MNENNTNNTCGGACGCGHHKVGPIAIILIGVAALLMAFNVLITPYVFGIVWPILLIVAAAGKLCKCCGCGSK